MTINARITTALEPTGCLVVPDEKQDGAATYFVFNYDTVDGLFANDRPIYETVLVAVHLFAPVNTNTVALRRQAQQLLFAAGFTWPEVFDASDKEGQHWVLETKIEQEADTGEEAADGDL